MGWTAGYDIPRNVGGRFGAGCRAPRASSDEACPPRAAGEMRRRRGRRRHRLSAVPPDPPHRLTRPVSLLSAADVPFGTFGTCLSLTDGKPDDRMKLYKGGWGERQQTFDV